ncbi:MAG: hypothetical protein AB7I18_00170 [Candidatus Berkiella sp.]
MAMIFSHIKESVTDMVKFINHTLAKAASVSKVDPAQDAAWIKEGQKATAKVPDKLSPSVSEEAAARQAQEARTTQSAKSEPPKAR